MQSYLERVLNRKVVEVRDTPAFVGNRIGFQFLNNGLLLAEKYKEAGGIDYIDAIFGTFTGRSMPPLETVDYVGLDVHKTIIDRLASSTKDYLHSSYALPQFCIQLIEHESLGRKTGRGLYRLEKGGGRKLVLDLNTNEYRAVIDYHFPFVKQMKESLSSGNLQGAFKALTEDNSKEAGICLTLLLRYISYSAFVAKELKLSNEDVDSVMAEGFCWCPPFLLYRLLTLETDGGILFREFIPEDIKEFDAEQFLNTRAESKYHLWKFFGNFY